MTTKIATVANLAVHVFQQHSVRAALACSRASANHSPHVGGPPNGRIDSMLPNNSSSSNSATSLPPDSLQRLLCALRSLTPKDVGFDQRWISGSNVYAAPVAYVHIMENEIFSMGIFILRPGSRIPLHDHPGMFGILRVIYGSLRCRSFTRLHNIKSSDSNLSNVPLSKLTDSKWQFSDIIVARPHQDVVVSSDSPAQVLSPDEGNLHEISAVDGPAVFLDILSPPYDHDLGTRECRFYREVVLPSPLSLPRSEVTASSQIDSSGDGDVVTSEPDSFVGQITSNPDAQSTVIYLVETNQPKDYWCESAEYVGPSVI